LPTWVVSSKHSTYKLFGITISRVGLSVTIEAGGQYRLRVRKWHYERREHMTAIRWARYPQVAALPAACTWLTIQSDLGLAGATIEAYGRALQDYLTFCSTQQIVPET